MTKERIDIKRIKTLDDSPSSSDEFRGKSHENVANALLEVISSNEGGYAIGLEGSWGSGKSTVISLAENSFDKKYKNNDYLFFNFDAWAHQGDPIRRSFLECLFGFLYEKNIVSLRGWTHKLRKIRSQQKRIISESVPKVPAFNYIMVIYGLLLPFIIIWANSNYDANDITTLIYPAIYVVMIPALIALIVYSYRQFYDTEYKNLPVLPSTRYLSEKNKTEQYIHTDDATTIEFNKYFDDLVNQIAKKNKKLIVVIDNLDRLSPKHVKSIWGTMRNFFTAEYLSDRQELLKRVYLVVPYDRKYISSVFSENETYENNVNNDFPSKSSRSISGFIKKTFKISLQVSQPILTHWKKFFYKKLDKAFDNQLNDEQKYDLYKLFEFKNQQNQLNITPRSIKKYINSLAIQVIEWNNKIPIKYLGLYILNKDEVILNYRRILDYKLLDERTRNYLSGEDWLKFLAAAYHKVDPNEALQITLSNPISNALTNSSHEILEIQQKEEWFGDILSTVIEDYSAEWARSEQQTFSVVAKNLSRIDIQDREIAVGIWNNLAIKLKNLGQIKSPDKNIAEGFEIIIRKSNSDIVRLSCHNLFKSLIGIIPEGINVEVFARNYADYFIVINSALKDKFGKIFVEELYAELSLPTNSKFIIYIASYLYKGAGLDLSLFYKKKSISLDNELANIVNSDSIFPEFPQGIRSLLKSRFDINFNPLISNIRSKIESNSSQLTEDIVEHLLETLFLLESENEGNAGKILEVLSNSGVLVALHTKTADYSKATALIILQLISHYNKIDTIPQQNKVPNYGNNLPGLNNLKKILKNPSEHNEILKSLVNIACEFGYFQKILTSISSNPIEYKMLKSIGVKMIENECINGVKINSVIQNYSLSRFIKDNQLVGQFFSLLDKEDIDENSISNISEISPEFLKDSIDSESKIGELLVAKIKNKLNSYGVEDWELVLDKEKERHELEFILNMISANCIPFLSEDFSQALLNHSVKILNNEISVDSYQESWYLLPAGMLENTRSTFYERLFDKLISEFHEVDRTLLLLNLFGEEFLKVINLESKADKFITNIVSAFMNSDEIDKLSWLEENIDTIKNCYEKSSKKTKGHLKEVIQTKGNESKEVKETIFKIAETLKIGLNWEVEKNDEED